MSKKKKKILSGLIIIAFVVFTIFIKLSGYEMLLKTQMKIYDVGNVYNQYEQTKDIKEYSELINKLNSLNLSYNITNDKITTDHISYIISGSVISMDDSEVIKEIEMIMGNRVIEEDYKLDVNEDQKILTRYKKNYIISSLACNSKEYVYSCWNYNDLILITMGCIIGYMLMVVGLFTAIVYINKK